MSDNNKTGQTDNNTEADFLNIFKTFNAESRSNFSTDTKGNIATDHFGSSSFWHYTTRTTASCILKGKSFLINNLAHMNDAGEAERHEKEKDTIYALCFCNTNTEKIPMWYLYAGAAGDGCALGLTVAKMRDFVQYIIDDKFTVFAVDKDGNVGQELHCGKDFLVCAGWVVYGKRGIDENIKYKRNRYIWPENDPKDTSIYSNWTYFNKDYPWEYEREFRILFKVMTKPSPYKLKIPIPEDICENWNIRLAPEIESKENFTSDLLKDAGLQKDTPPKFIDSTLHIKMDLINRNLESYIAYVINHPGDVKKWLDKNKSVLEKNYPQVDFQKGMPLYIKT